MGSPVAFPLSLAAAGRGDGCPWHEAEGRRSMRKSAGNGNLGVLTTENWAEMWLGMTGHWGYDEMPLELGRARTTTDVEGGVVVNDKVY